MPTLPLPCLATATHPTFVGKLALSLVATAAALAYAPPAKAINLVLDYTYDTNGFFNPGTTAGQQARATVSAAASFLSNLLEDSFPEVTAPDPFVSTAPGQPTLTLTFDWTRNFFHPGTGALLTLPGGTVAADDYVIYVGGRPLPGSTLGNGGPGGWGTNSTGTYYSSPANINAVNDISNAFVGLLTNRSQADGDFGGWGGALTFDSDVNWNRNHLVSPSGSQSDLYSVALHELVHALGIGGYKPSDPTEWQMNFNAAQTAFVGSAAVAAYGSAVPLSPDRGHWLEGTDSTVFGSLTLQESLMDPSITTGTRKQLTLLDAAGMIDIGWEITLPGTVLAGDYNNDLVVDVADYTVWRDNLGGASPIGSYAEWVANYGATAGVSLAVPEPLTLLLALLAVVGRPRR
ncbi:hypothetical protein [Botrimarina hoheduenensis]|uniref:Peptidase M10 metallopeptidase domain-containing protein n=1 Tax=Botrimarina hoheduenensis TaxID=2528000 RepID=A0A5C5VXR8_9BACT|nr:hypothetical protein [Botrimarina hoheduenensis]TWT42511.1 hypothetical protein Pla111_28160 [Botrimarina hoheduenensis]